MENLTAENLTLAQVQFVYPVFAMVVLQFIIAILMGKRRKDAIQKKEIDFAYFKTLTETGPLPRELLQVQRNYNNLFEMPILFYAVIPLILIFQKTDQIALIMAWVFVVCRYLHSFVHVTSNKLIHRARFFAISSLVLLVLWVRFFIQITF